MLVRIVTTTAEGMIMHTGIAPTPPMGWNSWDCFGASVTEAEVRDTAAMMAAQLRPFGWTYVVVDIQWYEPGATSHAYRPFVPLAMDGYSRLIPAVQRFPSAAAGAGFGPLAAYVHALGLKFGIHILRGIPRQAVHANTPLFGTDIGARAIAHTHSICRWNTDMYGVDAARPGAREYYRSLFQLYAGWGVDFVKVDDIAAPYQHGEIELIRDAIDHCGRPMVLSLSPGPAPLEHAEQLMRTATMWRMSDDLWDNWEDIAAQFERCARWAPFAGPDHWPDADMLPFGQLAVRDNGGHLTHLSHDEQITLLTLWCMARSPLMMGGDLRTLDRWTLDLLTRPDVLAILHASHQNQQLLRDATTVVWTAAGAAGQIYLACFNLDTQPTTVTVPFAQLDVAAIDRIDDLWSSEPLAPGDQAIGVAVAPHGARLLRLWLR